MRINNRDYDDIFQLAKEMYLAYDTYASELRKEELLAFIDSQDSKKAAKIKMLMKIDAISGASIHFGWVGISFAQVTRTQ